MDINLSEEIKIGAIFQIEKFTEDGTVTYQGPEFENLVLNQGLVLLYNYSVNALMTWINLGASGTAPEVTQTGLLDRKFSTNAVFNWQESAFGNVWNPVEIGFRRVFQFNIGTCTGTFREIGLSRDNNANYFNRQLIKDAQGNPIDLTVAANEGLRITVITKMVPVDPNKVFSEVFELDVKGATGGSITFTNGITTTSDLSWDFFRSQQNWVRYFIALAIPNVVQCWFSNNKYYILFGPMTTTPSNFAIGSSNLWGGSGPATLTNIKAFSAPEVKSFQHTNETTLQTTTVSYLCCPRVDLDTWGFGWDLNQSNYGTYNTNFDLGLTITGRPGASSASLVSAPTSGDAVLSKKYYWSPGALGTGNISLTEFEIGWLFQCKLLSPLVIPDVDEFEMTFNFSWG